MRCSSHDDVLLACDLDGTLLGNNSEISEFTAGVLLSCRKRGIVTAYCTGRNVTQLNNLISENLRPQISVVNNGAQVFSGGKLISNTCISVRRHADFLAALHSAFGARAVVATAQTEQTLEQAFASGLDHF